jgi:hypothetical protein
VLTACTNRSAAGWSPAIHTWIVLLLVAGACASAEEGVITGRTSAARQAAADLRTRDFVAWATCTPQPVTTREHGA